jgi:hypothetical protein
VGGKRKCTEKTMKGEMYRKNVTLLGAFNQGQSLNPNPKLFSKA